MGITTKTTKIGKITEKGQITLPASWRKKIKTNAVIFKEKGDFMEISPLYINKPPEQKEYTVFDAIRDNGGKGLMATDLLKIIKKIDK